MVADFLGKEAAITCGMGFVTNSMFLPVSEGGGSLCGCIGLQLCVGLPPTAQNTWAGRQKYAGASLLLVALRGCCELSLALLLCFPPCVTAAPIARPLCSCWRARAA